jgi:DNA-binding response OmpR family regulator
VAPSKGKILVVDDDRLVLATVAHGLSQAGFEVTDVDNGDEAILQARQHRHDLALLDIRMEGKSGFDVAAYLREYCQMPFIFLSAFADPETLKQVHALGAAAYLIKPLDVSQIVPVVEATLKNARAHSAGPEPQAEALLPSLTASPQPSSSPAEPLSPAVHMAVGVLMHRYSLTREQARQRLARMAAHDGLGLGAQAERLLQAVELLCANP